jgi:uncharacterized protein (DUF1697 family)
MHRQIAFLRAINIGGHVVKMERLRAIFESLGLKEVETFIASGNVVFTTKRGRPEALERKIEATLAKELGYEVKTFVRTNAELAEIAEYQPFKSGRETPATRLFVGFLASEPSGEARGKLLAAAGDADEFHIHVRELYWRCHVPSSESKFSGALLEKTLGMLTTIRNSNTVKRLVAKYPPAASEL